MQTVSAFFVLLSAAIVSAGVQDVANRIDRSFRSAWQRASMIPAPSVDDARFLRDGCNSAGNRSGSRVDEPHRPADQDFGTRQADRRIDAEVVEGTQ